MYEQANHEMITRWKPSAILEWTAIVIFLLQAIYVAHHDKLNFHISYLLFDTENLQWLAVHEMFTKRAEAQNHQQIILCIYIYIYIYQLLPHNLTSIRMEC